MSGAGQHTPESREDFWGKILDEHDDDAHLPVEITEMDGTVSFRGTLSVAGLRETLNNPEYQAMMRRAQELKGQGEFPIPETLPQDPQA